MTFTTLKCQRPKARRKSHNMDVPSFMKKKQVDKSLHKRDITTFSIAGIFAFFIRAVKLMTRQD